MLLFVIFLFLIAIGIPIAISMGMTPMAYNIFTRECPFKIISYMMFDAIDNFSLIAIPLFILGGNLITKVGVTEALVEFSGEIIGRVRGGLSHVNVIVSTLFGGLNGSAVGDAAAVGAILIKPMKKMGFSAAYSAAVTSASGTISGIIPPSIPFIIYASVVPEVSVGALFIGGILPGVLICLGQCISGYLLSVRRNYPKIVELFRLRKFAKDSLKAIPALILVVLIIFGLRSGLFTPTEIASVIVVYSLILGFFLYRNLTLHTFLTTLHETAITTGIIFLVIGCAGPFMWILTAMGVTASVSSQLVAITKNPFLWWAIMFFFLLFSGMIMDTAANLLILGPIAFSALKEIGFDPFVGSLAIVIILLMGVTTPPVGISLYTTCAIAEEGIEKASSDVIPFLIPEAITVAIILIFPESAKFLPRLFGYEV